MRYSLMNKDVCVAEFSLVEEENEYGAPVSNIEELRIFERNLYFSIVGAVGLKEFLLDRKAPKHRRHIEELFHYLDMKSLTNFLSISYGLSLNDSVWVRPQDVALKWRDVNAYDNKFSEVIAHYAFSGAGFGGLQLRATSPEYTTDGALPKCWIRDPDGTIKLQKGSSSDLGFRNSGFEPCAEFYAAHVAKQLRLYPFVDYDVRKVDGKLSSICGLFTSENTAYVSMAKELCRLSMVAEGYPEVLKKHSLGESYKDLIFFDCLICNPDRHLGNFGLLKRSVDYRVVGLSPIFDNGMGLGSLWVKDNYDGDDIIAYTGKEGPRLFGGRGYIPVGRSYADDRRRAAAERLRGWTIPKHPLYNWPDWKYDAMNELLQHQVREILR